jgi:hypothetical protein
MDDGPWIEWNAIARCDIWDRREVHDSRQGRTPVRFNLTAGNHTFIFAHREDGVKLDQIRLRRR